jgi:hypothetical protein
MAATSVTRTSSIAILRSILARAITSPYTNFIGESIIRALDPSIRKVGAEFSGFGLPHP